MRTRAGHLAICAADGSADRPSATTPRLYRFPPFTRRQLANGVEIIIASVPRLPLVSIRVVVDAGAATESSQLAGVATLTARALAEGTTRLAAAGLADAFERLGGSLTSFATWDDVTVTTSVLRDRFPAVLELLGEVLMTPAFQDREIDRLRAERLAELLELRAEPRGLADEMFESMVYAPTSRFSLPEGGSTKTVASLNRDRIREFYDERFQPGGTTVIVVGDLTTDHIIDRVGGVFGGWGGKTPAMTPRIALRSREHTAISVVCRPGAPQTELRAGHVGLPRRHPDYYAVVVMNTMLGGAFNSRLNLNLREQHAFTYGASSSFDWRRDAGPFAVSTAVETDVTGASVSEITRELTRIREEPPTAEELTHIISYLDGIFPIRFETTEAIAAALASLKVFGLPEDYYDTYRSRIRAVSSSDIETVARDHVHPEQLQIVAVGDHERIGPQLESLNMGPVRYYDADGVEMSRH